MVHNNQHIVAAPHLIVNMNMWHLYDLNGFETNNVFVCNVSNNWLMFTIVGYITQEVC